MYTIAYMQLDCKQEADGSALIKHAGVEYSCTTLS